MLRTLSNFASYVYAARTWKSPRALPTHSQVTHIKKPKNVCTDLENLYCDLRVGRSTLKNSTVLTGGQVLERIFGLTRLLNPFEHVIVRRLTQFDCCLAGRHRNQVLDGSINNGELFDGNQPAVDLRGQIEGTVQQGVPSRRSACVQSRPKEGEWRG